MEINKNDYRNRIYDSCYYNADEYDVEKISLGMIETVKIFVLTLLFSLPFGLVVAWGRMSRIKNSKMVG